LICEFVSGFDIRISDLPDAPSFSQLPELKLNSGTKHYCHRKK
jgi:hypothetical protein